MTHEAKIAYGCQEITEEITQTNVIYTNHATMC